MSALSSHVRDAVRIAGTVSPLAHLGGAVFAPWMILFIAQALFVAQGKARWHRIGSEELDAYGPAMTLITPIIQRWIDEGRRDPDGLWAQAADELRWFRRWDRVFKWDPPTFRWFGRRRNESRLQRRQSSRDRRRCSRDSFRRRPTQRNVGGSHSKTRFHLISVSAACANNPSGSRPFSSIQRWMMSEMRVMAGPQRFCSSESDAMPARFSLSHEQRLRDEQNHPGQNKAPPR